MEDASRGRPGHENDGDLRTVWGRVAGTDKESHASHRARAPAPAARGGLRRPAVPAPAAAGAPPRRRGRRLLVLGCPRGREQPGVGRLLRVVRRALRAGGRAQLRARGGPSHARPHPPGRGRRPSSRGRCGRVGGGHGARGPAGWTPRARRGHERGADRPGGALRGHRVALTGRLRHLRGHVAAGDGRADLLRPLRPGYGGTAPCCSWAWWGTRPGCSCSPASGGSACGRSGRRRIR